MFVFPEILCPAFAFSMKPLELHWLFRSQEQKSVVYLPGFLSILLIFCLCFYLQVFLIGSLNTQAASTMASRGRGRGRGQLTFNMEAVGIGKGDALPPPTLQPSPLFPVSVCPPPRPRKCPLLPVLVCEPECLLGRHETILILLFPVSMHSSHG